MATATLSPQPVPSLPHYLPANDNTEIPECQLGWLRPTPRDTPISEIIARLKEDGYVFVKGVIPRGDVLKMREQYAMAAISYLGNAEGLLTSYFSSFSSVGMTKPDAPFVDGIHDPSRGPSIGLGGGDLLVNAEEDLNVLEKCHTDPFYVSFTDHPALRTMVRSLTDWKEELLLRRTMLRHNVPNAPTTGVHYDKLFLRDGDAYFLTAWVPIGDIAVNGGGLIYLEDSVELGKAIEEDFSHRSAHMNREERISAFNTNMTKFGVLCDSPKQFEEDHRPDHQTPASNSALMAAEKKTYKWLVANYEAGDVVFHHPHAIHASSRNEDKSGKIRLSTDLRFYDKEELERGGVDKRWLNFWTLGDNL